MEVLVILVAMGLVPVVIAALAVTLAARSLRRANRISPRLPTTAPTVWLLLPDRPARLHRRLRRAVAMVRGAAELHGGTGRRSTPSAVAELADDLEQRACVIDAHLVVASRAAGVGRRRMLATLDAQVREVERLAGRIAGLASSWAAQSVTLAASPEALQAIGERLDALEAGTAEIRAVASGE